MNIVSGDRRHNPLAGGGCRCRQWLPKRRCACAPAIRVSSTVPIIVLSERDDPEERIRGLDAGADDYLVKPLNPRELMARIKVVARRTSFAPGGPMSPTPRSLSIWKVAARCPEPHAASRRWHRPAILTASEFQLLEALVKSPRTCRCCRRDQYGHSIEVRMSRMRRRLCDPRR